MPHDWKTIPSLSDTESHRFGPDRALLVLNLSVKVPCNHYAQNVIGSFPLVLSLVKLG